MNDGVPALTWGSFYFNVSDGVNLNLNNFDFSAMPNSDGWKACTGGNVSKFGIFSDDATYNGRTVDRR